MHKDEIWSRVLESMKATLPETVIRAWFDDTAIHTIEDDKVVIVTVSGLKRDAISKRYQGMIARALFQLFEKDFSIEVYTRDEVDDQAAQNAVVDTEQFVFDRFVVGPNNQFAYSAAVSVSETNSKGYNPLFIYGGSGLGKTHLLYAIRNRIKEKRPECVVNIFSSEQFTHDLVIAIETGRRAAFHEKYRGANMLIVDDIHFISNKEFVQEEFFHTFNTLYETGGQIVMASDKPPKDMKKLEERLRSRFEWGLVIDIQPPDLETRIAILRSKAQSIGLPIPETVTQHIAQNITTNVRQLEGIIKKMMGYHDLMGFSLNVDTATLAITDIMSENPGLNPTPDLILQRVCDYYGVNQKDVLSNSRRAKLVQARHISIFLIREITQKSLHEIADILNRDHTTVMHAIERIKEQASQSSDIEDDLRIITENIRSE